MFQFDTRHNSDEQQVNELKAIESWGRKDTLDGARRVEMLAEPFSVSG